MPIGYKKNLIRTDWSRSPDGMDSTKLIRPRQWLQAHHKIIDLADSTIESGQFSDQLLVNNMPIIDTRHITLHTNHSVGLRSRDALVRRFYLPQTHKHDLPVLLR